MRNLTVTAILMGVLGLGACQSYQTIEQSPSYWQRHDAQSALYLRGPKAQHQLHKDIAGCTVEVRELERLGSIREAMPPKAGAKRSDGAPANGMVAGYDTPERDGPAFAAYFDYQDFEGCMQHAGWERVKFVPHHVADEARTTFIESIFDPEYRNKELSRHYPDDYAPETDYSNLNE